MVRVLVGAVGCVERDAPALLVGVATLCLSEVGVDLERQGCAGREQLEQEGEAGSEGADRGGAEFAFGVGVDDVREGLFTGGGAGRGAARAAGSRSRRGG